MINENVRQLEIKIVSKCSDDESAFLAILKEKDGDRALPILMERSDALRLMLKISKEKHSGLPTTMADVMKDVFTQCNMEIEEIRIVAVQAGITYCHMLYKVGTSFHMVRYLRATEGLILATTFGVPITIFEPLLEQQYMRELGEGRYSVPVNTMNLEVLRQALKQAVNDENYELAAQLRDEIEKRI